MSAAGPYQAMIREARKHQHEIARLARLLDELPDTKSNNETRVLLKNRRHREEKAAEAFEQAAQILREAGLT